MSIDDDLKNDILKAGFDDWLALFFIEGLARTRTGRLPDDESRELILRILATLAESGLVEFGTVSRSGFVRWDEPIAASISRIEDNWPQDPYDRGFEAWIRNTELGMAIAQNLAKP